MNFDAILSSINNVGYNIIYFDVLKPLNLGFEAPFIMVLIVVGILYANIKTKFYGIRKIPLGFKYLFKSSNKKSSKEQISPVKALFSAIAGSTGIGNTAGIAALIGATNPGCVLWILICATLCNSFKFLEIYLSHRFRDKTGKSVIGGPFRYITEGLALIGFRKFGKALSGIYVFLLIISSFGGPNILQSNQIAQVVSGNIECLQGKEQMIAGVVAVLVFFIIMGGIQRISGFLSIVLPILVTVLFSSCLIVILYNYKKIPDALLIMIKTGFSFDAASKGAFIFMIFKTMQRLSLSTETTLGTTAIMHSNSDEEDSTVEATSGMISCVVSAFTVAFMSGLVVVVSGAYLTDTKGILTISKAFSDVSKYLPIALIATIPFMSLNVIIGWSYYGIKATTFVFGQKAKYVYIALYVFVAFLGGCITDFDIVFKSTDVFNTALCIPNILAIMLMFNRVIMPDLKSKKII